ncbi:type II toxin-antitoxin system RelB/DinJ family antitoxin [bacterium]|nr:type II toxin-antitoxin system RelB/DinJ family antitoxin [bacterium]
MHRYCNAPTHIEVIIVANTAAISMRVDPKLKSEAGSVFSSFGLTPTEAINVFLHTSVMEGGLPFDVLQPRFNAATESAMDEARGIMAGRAPATRYDSTAEMLAAFDEEDA